MSEDGSSGWWRLTGFAIIGGGVALGGWFISQSPSSADPAPKLTAVVSDPGTWSRTPTAAGSAKPPATAYGEVMQTAGTAPQGPALPSVQTLPGSDGASPYGPAPIAPALLPVPASPAIPTMPSIPPAMTAVPASGMASAAGSSAPLMPAVPPLPGTTQGLPTIPAIPTMPIQTVAPPGTLALPSPTPPAGTPGPLPSFQVGPGSMPPVSSPALPPSPGGIALPPAIAPSAPPLQFPDTIQPVMPARPESNLPRGNEGINVKPGSPSGTALPAWPAAPTTMPAPYKIPVTSLDTIEDRPKAADGPMPYSERDAFAYPAVNTPGDTNMALHRQHAAALAILGGMFMIPATPVDAADPVDKTDVAALKKQIEDNTAALKDIKGQLSDLQTLVKEKLNAKSNDSIMAQLDALKKSVEAIEQQLNTLQTRSLRVPTATPPIGELKTGMGTVKIVNDYPVPISMVINGTSYRIEPRKAEDVPVPAGDFVYQLVQSGAPPTKSAIRDKETVTLRIK